MKRLYICHTFYQVYVTFLKEFALGNIDKKEADIVLSVTATDYDGLEVRLQSCDVFNHVYIMDERIDGDASLVALKKDRGNIVFNLFQRMVYTKRRAKVLAPRIPKDLNFKAYDDIYVYCDSDPIGYYLSFKHIYYHALEDGLNCLEVLDAAHYDNRGHFGIKKWMAAHNLIHIQNGYGKYCIDMEINDETNLKFHCPKYIVVPRKPLEERLTSEEKSILVKNLIPNADEFLSSLRSKANGDCVLFLTMPHPKPEETRKKICDDIIRDYCEGCHVVIKPHPRETLDYASYRPDCTVLKGRFPIEILNYVEGIRFKKAITIVSTALESITFCDEKIRLGEDFWDAYEDPELHKYNKTLSQSKK